MIMRYYLGLAVGHTYGYHQRSSVVNLSATPQGNNDEVSDEGGGDIDTTIGMGEAGVINGIDGREVDGGCNSETDDEEWQDGDEDKNEGRDDCLSEEEELAMAEMYG
jgi:hypothetical protein